jgi:predicted DNA binding CopG/RHH family protein
MRKIKLDPAEKAIEHRADEYIPVSAQRRKALEAILDPARKTKNINIRINEVDLARLKQRAQEEGVPYQTLVSSVLHRYVSDRLVDEKQILKSLELLRSK